MDTAIQIKEVLMKSEEMFGADPQISSFEKSLQEFKKMVDSGVVKPRGYNIRTADTPSSLCLFSAKQCVGFSLIMGNCFSKSPPIPDVQSCVKQSVITLPATAVFRLRQNRKLLSS